MKGQETKMEQMRGMRRLLYRWGMTWIAVQEKQFHRDMLKKEIEDSYDTVKAIIIDGMPKGKGVKASGVEGGLASAERQRKGYVELSEILSRQIAEEMRFKLAIDDLIKELSKNERDVIRMRYRDNMKPANIARAIHYTERHVARLEYRAVEKMSENVRKCPGMS